MATVKVQRSTVGGVEQTAEVPWSEDVREVVSYVVLAGSVNEAAKTLGLRVLGRREQPDPADVVAELHERDVAGSFWCVREAQS